MISIKRNLAESVVNAIDNLLHQWSPNTQCSDWQCAFCGERPRTNQTQIVHRKDCEGLFLMDELNKAIEQGEFA